jgi:hypothetical protein
MQPSFLLQHLLLIASVLVVPTLASCPSEHYPAPSRGDCVPCATMHQWQIMGETTGSAIVTALVRLDNISKHVQCVTTSGLDCQWGRSELPGSINDTSTLIALGCDSLNRIYFPLRVYYGEHWCNSVWMFLFKYCGSNLTYISPSVVRAKAVTDTNVSASHSFGPNRPCNGSIAGGHALIASTCQWVSSDAVQLTLDSRPWDARLQPLGFLGYRFVLGNELFLADDRYNLTIMNNAVEVLSISPPSSVVTFPITVVGVNFPLESSACILSFDVFADLSCNVSSTTVLRSEDLPLTFPTSAFLTRVTFQNPFISEPTRLVFSVMNRIPVVASLVPSKTYGGGIVTVFGANFVPNVGTCSALVTTTSSSTSLACEVITPQYLVVRINYNAAPSSTPGNIVLSFTVPPTTMSPLPLTVLATPAIIGPLQPFAYTGSIVTLMGTSFHPADSQTAQCFICSNASSCLVASETTIVVDLSVNPTGGLCDIVVKLRTPQMRYVDSPLNPKPLSFSHSPQARQTLPCSKLSLRIT